MGDDPILELCIDLLREDAAGDELVFCGVRAAGDDAADVSVAHTGKDFKLGRSGGIDVEESSGLLRRMNWACLCEAGCGGEEAEGDEAAKRRHWGECSRPDRLDRGEGTA